MTLGDLIWDTWASTPCLMPAKKKALMSKTKTVGTGHGADVYVVISGHQSRPQVGWPALPAYNRHLPAVVPRRAGSDTRTHSEDPRMCLPPFN
jgi:hypothetical protein